MVHQHTNGFISLEIIGIKYFKKSLWISCSKNMLAKYWEQDGIDKFKSKNALPMSTYILIYATIYTIHSYLHHRNGTFAQRWVHFVANLWYKMVFKNQIVPESLMKC